MRNPFRQRRPEPEVTELPEDLLDLVVGGAGDPPPDVLERLLRDGVLLPGRTPPAPGRP